MDGIDVIAYEPSKGFRDVVRALLPGDSVRVVASVREQPRTLNLEKLELVDLIEARRKAANPVCPVCRKRAKSMGRSGTFRCARCRRLFPRSRASPEPVARSILPGWYEPPVCSRRHLAKPLKRLRGPLSPQPTQFPA